MGERAEDIVVTLMVNKGVLHRQGERFGERGVTFKESKMLFNCMCQGGDKRVVLKKQEECGH